MIFVFFKFKNKRLLMHRTEFSQQWQKSSERFNIGKARLRCNCQTNKKCISQQSCPAAAVKRPFDHLLVSVHTQWSMWSLMHGVHFKYKLWRS